MKRAFIMDAHTGTHVNAPLYMSPDGQAIESIALERLVRPCIVIDLTSVKAAIGADDLHKRRLQKDDCVLPHKALFAVDTIIVEGLRLADVEPGLYQMVAATLRLTSTCSAV